MINEEELSDEEKSFAEWLKHNIVANVDLIILKKAYLDGFAAGWQHKQKYTASEWLSK